MRWNIWSRIICSNGLRCFNIKQRRCLCQSWSSVWIRCWGMIVWNDDELKSKPNSSWWYQCACKLLHVACSSCPQVYIFMGEHLRELCRTLQLSDELRLKIWTCFEHSLVHCTDLMVDRHLDQLLLCSIYIIAKVSKTQSKFNFTFLTLYIIIVLLLQVSNVEILFKNIISCYSACLAANMNASLNQFSLIILHRFTRFMTVNQYVEWFNVIKEYSIFLIPYQCPFTYFNPNRFENKSEIFTVNPQGACVKVGTWECCLSSGLGKCADFQRRWRKPK